MVVVQSRVGEETESEPIPLPLQHQVPGQRAHLLMVKPKVRLVTQVLVLVRLSLIAVVTGPATVVVQHLVAEVLVQEIL